MNPDLLQTLAVLLAKASKGDNSQSVWVTALIASGSAIVGAMVGGIATYLASSRLEKRLRKARAAIRRKAKIYTPLRSELSDLLSYLEGSNALRRIGTEPWPTHRWGMSFPTWEEMKEDGRALTLGKKPVESMEHVSRLINAYNEEFDRGELLARDITRQALASHPGANQDWQGAPDLRHFIEHSIQPNEVGIDRLAGEPEDSRSPGLHRELVDRIESDTRTKDLVDGVSNALEGLKASLGQAIRTLEKSMRAIANKYEVPSEED